jgi:uncharacterized protein
MIIFIHGFGSNGKGTKSEILKKELNVVSPSLSTIPDLAISTLEDLIEYFLNINEPVKIIGSSLGGFYAIYLSKKYNIPAVLINPAVFAYKTLTRAIGSAVNYYDNTSYEWNENHLKMLKKYYVKNPDIKNLYLLTQTGDEVLNYEEAVYHLTGVKMIIEEGGNHGFQNIETKIEQIKDFFFN